MLPPDLGLGSTCWLCGKKVSSCEKTDTLVPLPAARSEKAAKVFPRPVAGLLRPVVRGQTLRYNTKRRLGRGFSHEELKVRRVPHCVHRRCSVSIAVCTSNRSCTLVVPLCFA